eukprot:s1613_g11.t1
MATTRNYQVKVTVPNGATPGMVLSVPVKNGSDKVQIRVPDGCGVGSVLALLQPEGSDDWELKVLEAVAHEEVSKEVPMDETEDSRDPFPQDKLNIELSRLDTTVGPIDILLRHDWAPHGARRFIELVSGGDLTNLAFYRAIQGCIVQFGLPPKRMWAPIPDDPPTGVPFLQGAVSFASVGPASRRATLFICVGDMSHCLGDKSWETPIGAVEESSLDVLDRIDTTYGDIVEFGGEGPDTSRIQAEGNAYLQTYFPKLSYVKSAMMLPDGALEGAPQPPSTDPGPPTRPNGLTAEDIAEAAERARVSALEAANMANQAASVTDPDEMVVAVRRAREAANAAEAAAQAAEAAHAAARSRRSTREVAPLTPQPAAVPVLPAGAVLQHPAPHFGPGAMNLQPWPPVPSGQVLQGMPQGLPQSVLQSVLQGAQVAPQGMVHIPVPANVGSDGRSQMPMLPYVQPQLQQLQQPQQPQLQQQSQLHQACLGGPVASTCNGMLPHMPGKPHMQMDLT